MGRSQSSTHARLPARRPRRGAIRWNLLAAASGAVVLLGAGGWALRGFNAAATNAELLTQRATIGAFTHDVVERGELESSANVSVRCEVQSRTPGSGGVKIIEIVPEGTPVKQGDFLVKFDDATLQSERTTQQISVSSAEALAAQSANDLVAARIARKEYEFGEFESEREKIFGEILVAKENESRAADTVEFLRKMVRMGYMSEAKVRSSRFDLAKARSDLKIATTKLNALVEYTRVKKISELDAKVKTCESKLTSDEAKLALERHKLEVIEDQIAKCRVTAPAAGQVVYDHEQDQWRGAEYQIKAGAVVNEQRVVIRLPDPKQMQAVTRVAESRIDLIKPGMPATLEVEGMPGVELKGKVTKVNEYPAPEGWSSVKEYATMVQVIDPPPGLRPGMTARVAIRVEAVPSALQVPIQAVVERGGKHYCLILRSGAIESREVPIGSTNEKFLVIRDGLVNNDEVLMNPRVHLGNVHLPESSAAKEPKTAADEQRDKNHQAQGEDPAQPAPAAPARVQASVGGTPP
jgi:HlyD family secretion protein